MDFQQTDGVAMPLILSNLIHINEDALDIDDHVPDLS